MSQQSLFETKRAKRKTFTKWAYNEFKRTRDESWDFKNIPASTGVYGIHPYPAMFHFLVIRQLLQEFSKEADMVFDPFMGSGVVGVECLINNRHFVGYDINPLAILIAKVRCKPLPLKNLLTNLELIKIRYFKTKPEIFEFPNINYWFKPHVIQELSKLRKAIYSLDSEPFIDFYKVVFSEVVRRVSNTDHNEFKLLRREKTDNLDIMETFTQISLRNINLIYEFYKKFPPTETKIKLENKNILDDLNTNNGLFDLVITSPPYGDSRTTVAYGQFSRLSLRWLGFEENVDKTSLGCRPKEIAFDLPSNLLYEYLKSISSKDDKRAKEVYSFYKDLFEAIKVIALKVKKRGIVCFVVGNRRVKGVELPTDIISAEFFENLGFQHQKTIVRAISNKRMPGENAPSNIKGEKDFTMRYEYIVILEKS